MSRAILNNLMVLLLLLVAGLMAFVSGCKPKLEVGQVWETPQRGDPFKTDPPVRQKIIALQDGYVQYERLDEPAKGYIGSYSESIFRVGVKLVSLTDEIGTVISGSGPALDLTWDKYNNRTAGPPIILCEPKGSDSGITITSGDATAFAYLDGKLKIIEVGQVWESETVNPFDVHVQRKILAIQDGYVKYERVDTDAEGITCSMSVEIFKTFADKLVPDEPTEEPESVKADTPTEPNAPPVWGQGELPVNFAKIFGNDNPARLNYVQNQVLDKHAKIIVEIAKRVLMLEYVDPNEVPLETEWVGNPSVANPDAYHLNGGYLIDFMIGFRSDGVVAWKYTDPNEAAK